MGLFFGGLIPVRLAEWYWLLRIAFKQKVQGHPQTENSILLGTFVSFGLDAIGVAAAFVAARRYGWIC